MSIRNSLECQATHPPPPQGDQFSVRAAFRPTIEAATQVKTVSEFLKAIDRSRSQDEYVLRVHPVSRAQFKDIWNERQRKERKFRFLYLDEIRLLIVTIPSGPHEVVLRYIEREIDVQLNRLSLLDDLEGRGGQEHSYQGGGGLSGSGEGDGSYVPLSARSDKDAWPTLVIEVGYSQSLPELRAKGQVWFRRSNFDVKIVLLVKLNRQDRSMTIEKWKAIPAPTRPGPTTRASSAAAAPGGWPEPQCIHTIRVESPGTNQQTDPQAHTVTSGDLRLEFMDLFLRNPGPNERDIVINEPRLQYIAMRGFQLMG